LPNKNTKKATDITVAVATVLPNLPRDQISFCTTSLLKYLIPLSVYKNKYPISLKNWAIFFIKYLLRAFKNEALILKYFSILFFPFGLKPLKYCRKTLSDFGLLIVNSMVCCLF